MRAATVMRLRSRLARAGRSQTSPNKTSSVSSTSLGEKSPMIFWAGEGWWGMAKLLGGARADPRDWCCHHGASFAVEVGGGDAAVHEEVAAGCEPAVRPEEERGDGR